MYEWDETKRKVTLSERGIDFADIALFDWDTAQTILDDRADYGEMRLVSTGYIKDRLFVCCWVERQTRVRIISLRKANDREIKAYQTRTAH